MKTVVHVDQNSIRHNLKTGDRLPPLTVLTYKSNDKAHEVVIHDDAGKEVGRFVYRPDKPLSCGARLWFETRNPVTLVTSTDGEAA